MTKEPASRTLTAVCLLLITCAFHSPAAAQEPGPMPDGPMSFAHERLIRKVATHVVMPAYPEEARQKGVQGLAVALIRMDSRGEVVNAELLSAPDGSIGEAVLAAVRQWQFDPIVREEGRTLEGTLRFNFAIEGGEGRVGYGPLPRCQRPRWQPLLDGTRRMRLADFDCER